MLQDVRRAHHPAGRRASARRSRRCARWRRGRGCPARPGPVRGRSSRAARCPSPGGGCRRGRGSAGSAGRRRGPPTAPPATGRRPGPRHRAGPRTAVDRPPRRGWSPPRRRSLSSSRPPVQGERAPGRPRVTGRFGALTPDSQAGPSMPVSPSMPEDARPPVRRRASRPCRPLRLPVVLRPGPHLAARLGRGAGPPVELGDVEQQVAPRHPAAPAEPGRGEGGQRGPRRPGATRWSRNHPQSRSHPASRCSRVSRRPATPRPRGAPGAEGDPSRRGRAGRRPTSMP